MEKNPFSFFGLNDKFGLWSSPISTYLEGHITENTINKNKTYRSDVVFKK
jgi:hypothetical protein